MKTVLIIGATGTMGEPLVNYLNNKGIHIVAVARKKSRFTTFSDSVDFILGDAYDKDFMIEVLRKYHYDSIIDFMWRSYDNFIQWFDLMCKSTKQYVILSTSGVYANSEDYINEESKRYIDLPENNDDINEYHIEKARIEDYARASSHDNWTIVRPHMIFSENNLRIGVYYQDVWLYRCLHNRTTVIPRIILPSLTSYSYAGDIAKEFFAIIDNEKSLKEAYTLSTDGLTNTEEVINVITDTLKSNGYNFKVMYLDNPEKLYKVLPSVASRVKRDRIVDRKMDVTKIKELADNSIVFSDWKQKIRECVEVAIDRSSKDIYKMVILHAWMDRLAHEKTPLREIRGKVNKLTYFLMRYIPLLYYFLKKANRMLKRS